MADPSVPVLEPAEPLRVRRITTGPVPLVQVRARQGGPLLAVFTQGARSVWLHGPRRSFHEDDIVVMHEGWVRALPRPFEEDVDVAWLRQALGANALREPDILALCMQYAAGAPEHWAGGQRIAGPAGYGATVDGVVEEGSDFNDFLGLPWTYADGRTDPPEARQHGCLDCSGYMRMVWGYRRHAPTWQGLGLARDHAGTADVLPRRAHEMYTSAPGVAIVRRGEPTLAARRWLQAGDLVFFDADTAAADHDRLDHVGLFLGVDRRGHWRFVSSRKTFGGPTFGDVGGASRLDGQGLYARTWAAARRL